RRRAATGRVGRGSGEPARRAGDRDPRRPRGGQAARQRGPDRRLPGSLAPALALAEDRRVSRPHVDDLAALELELLRFFLRQLDEEGLTSLTSELDTHIAR